jgi:hypothetical protein
MPVNQRHFLDQLLLKIEKIIIFAILTKAPGGSPLEDVFVAKWWS